jgi:hypothetical protein
VSYITPYKCNKYGVFESPLYYLIYKNKTKTKNKNEKEKKIMINIINDTGNEKKDIFLETLGLYQNNEEEIRNKEFTQYRNETFIYRQQLMEVNPTSFRVFDLMSNLCEKNNTIIISCKDIALILNKTERTIQRAIKDLRSYNFITAIKYKKNNIYFLNPLVACRVDGATRVKLCKLYRETRIENGEAKKGEGTIEPQIELTDINKEEFEKRRNSETISYKKIKPSGKVQKLDFDDVLDQFEMLEQITKKEYEKILNEGYKGTDMEFNHDDFENYVNSLE